MYENKSPEEVYKELSVDPSFGLSEEEVASRRKTSGLNKLKEKEKDPWYKVFWHNIKDPMTLVLGIAAAISLTLAIINMSKGLEGPEALADVFIIFGVVILNAVIGTVQELKAEKALEALKKMSAPTATVRRSGKTMEVKAEELVPGDIVILEEGRTVPADLRLIKTFLMKADESSLTGESLPSSKDAELTFSKEAGVGDRSNIAYMSTPIVYGHGEGVVIATGENTEIGKIANMLSSGEEENTQLQKKLAGLSKFLGWLTIGIVLLMLAVKLIYALIQGNLSSTWDNALLDSVALAVAAIPEGLTAVVTIVLALGMGKMVKVNTVVRRLASVETLGAVSVVCSDKTGTLTQNKMTVVRSYVDGRLLDRNSFNFENMGFLAKGLCLCSDAKVDGGVYGDPTEVALVELSNGLGMHKADLEKECPRVDELPFDSVRKMMSTQHLVASSPFEAKKRFSFLNRKDNGPKKLTFTKGALDQVLKHVTSIYIDGEIRPIKNIDIDGIIAASGVMASDALRVLALAISSSDKISENDLTFVGLVGMVDPPREAAKPAVATLKKAGIVTVMITGDHKDTAFAIAKELGIADSLSQCMSGDQIDACSEEELAEKVKTVRVFARVSPANKVSIVKAIKSNGLVVAMTGDGVNDAPSLKAADIGIAMGITGTDVAKGAADMVLTDDNFASIEKAVEEGRGIYANIKKTILFLLSSNIGEVVAMVLSAIMGLPSPLIAIHLLWVNLITDSLPAVALGADKKQDDIMSEPPRDPKESLFSRGGTFIIFGYGLLIGLITLIAFLIKPWSEGNFLLVDILAYFSDAALGEVRLEEAQSMAFCVLALAELFHMLGMTSVTHSAFQAFFHKNVLLYIAFFLGIALQLAVIEIPGINTVFHLYKLSDEPIEYLWVFLLAILPLLVHEIVALVLFLKKKSKKK